jgi:2-haloacid dehalogenase
MGAYERLAPFPENRAVLVELRRRGIRAGILSNGDPGMLEPSSATPASPSCSTRS